MARNANLKRLLTLVKALGESSEGLPLDEIADVIGVIAAPPSDSMIASSSTSISRKASTTITRGSASPCMNS